MNMNTINNIAKTSALLVCGLALTGGSLQASPSNVLRYE